MNGPRLLDPRPITSPAAGASDPAPLPDELAHEAAGRLRAACVVLAGLWAISVVVNHLIAPYLGLADGQVVPWPPVADLLAAA